MSTSLTATAREYDFTGNRVLVTGGAGFIGSHLVDTLVQANNVVVLDDLSTGELEHIHPKATLVEGDVRERDTVKQAMSDADVVFHQAGLVSVEQSVQHPEESHSINVEGTMTVLDCARQTDTRVVAASSAAIYGDPSTVPVPESAQLRPDSIYGVDKLALDHYTRQFESLYGLPTVALRYFNVYGPRQSASTYSGVISTFFHQAESGGPLTIQGDGTQTRDFVHCSDVVRANIRAATTSHTGEAFNIGTGVETSVNDLAETVCDVVGVPVDTTTVPARTGDIQESCADIEKAQDKLGFSAQVSLREGLETLVPPDGVAP